MMGKAYLKSVFRTIKGNLSRFIFVTSIIAVGVAFVTGVGGISSKVTDSLSEYLEEKNVPDVIMKYGTDETEESEAIKGFVDEDRDYYQELLNSYSGIGSSISLFQMDMELDDLETRLYAYPLGSSINPIDVVTGEYPSSYDEILIEEPVDAMTQYQIGDTIEIDLSYFLGDYAPMFPDLLKFEFKVVGYAKNPLMFLKTADFSQVSQDENGDYLQLDRVIYTDLDLMESEIETRFEEATFGMMKGYIPRTDIYLCLNRVESEYFTDAYKDEINERIEGIKALGGVYESDVSYLSLEENASYLSVREIVEKVNTLASIFPMFFVAVVGLVVLTTCSRMVDEERPMLGCYKSLGYRDASIIGKYLLFVVAAGLIGSVIGIFLGMYTLPIIIYPAFEQGMFYMPAMTSKVDFLTGLYSAIGILGAALLVSYGVAKYTLHQTPAELLQPKAPKPGKKVFLERIGFIWKRLSFRYKSSFRNVFRYKGRLAMVVLSTAGSTALIFAGVGLFDVSDNISSDALSVSVDMSSTLRPIAVAIIIFAMALGILVIFNLANMNIGERRREVATLEVLGYYLPEVDSYIFREIFLMSLMGIALGIPLGVGLLYYVFNSLGFGGISLINWYSYILTIACALLFILLVRLFIIPKIHKIDMNDSLKSVE